LNKVSACIDKLKAEKNITTKKSNGNTKGLRISDFSFIKARKITEKLKSSLTEEIVNERAYSCHDL